MRCIVFLALALTLALLPGCQSTPPPAPWSFPLSRATAPAQQELATMAGGFPVLVLTFVDLLIYPVTGLRDGIVGAETPSEQTP